VSLTYSNSTTFVLVLSDNASENLLVEILAINYKWKEARAYCIKNTRKRRGSLMGSAVLLGK